MARLLGGVATGLLMLTSPAFLSAQDCEVCISNECDNPPQYGAECYIGTGPLGDECFIRGDVCEAAVLLASGQIVSSGAFEPSDWESLLESHQVVQDGALTRRSCDYAIVGRPSEHGNESAVPTRRIVIQ